MAVLILLLSVSAAAVLISDSDDAREAYRYNGDGTYTMTSPFESEEYGWTVVGSDGTSQSPVRGERSFTLHLDPGTYEIAHCVSDGEGNTLRYLDWIAVNSWSIWSGFDVTLSEGGVLVTQNVGASGYEWKVTDLYHTAYEGERGSFTPYDGVVFAEGPLSLGLSPGYYRIELISDRGTFIDYVLLDGTVERTFSWVYGGRDFEVRAVFPLSDLRHCYDSGISRTSGDPVALVRTDGSMEAMAAELRATFRNAFPELSEDRDLADFVLGFVQVCISYPPSDSSIGTDGYVYGQSEYWAYPLQTLHHGMGDCEDTSILCAALFDACGFPTGIGLIPFSHAFTLVALEGPQMPGVACWTGASDGLMYYGCETTEDTPVPVGRLSLGSPEKVSIHLLES